MQTSPNEKPTLCYVTDRRALRVPAGSDPESVLLERIRSAIDAGTDWIQIREKDLDARQLLRLTRAALRNSRESGSGARILVNDRFDVALAAEAAGVHLGEASLPLAIVAESKRSAAPAGFLAGASCHSVEGALQAARDGADYIFFGPVFATPSKAAFGAPQGLARLREVCSAVDIPVLAIGGITAEDAASCRQAGAAGIAGIRLFQETTDAAALAAKFRANIL